jgi:CHAT domain-containing protein
VKRLQTECICRRFLSIGGLALLAVCAVFISTFTGCQAPQSDAVAYQTIDRQIEAGELDSARDAAKRAWERAPNTQSGWKFKAQYAYVLIYQDRKQEAATLLADNVPAEFHSLTPRYQYLRAYLFARLHKDKLGKAISISMFKSSLTMAGKENDAATGVDALLLLALLDNKNTLDFLKQAEALARQNHFDRKQAEALNSLGLELKNVSDYSACVTYLLQGQPMAKRIHARDLEVTISANLGECLLSLGDLDRATNSLQEARSQMLDSDDLSVRAEVNLGLGKVSSLRQENQDAVGYFQKAFAIIQADTTAELYIPTTEKLAAGLIEEGRLDDAERSNELAGEALKKYETPDVYLQAFYALNRANIAAHRKQSADAEAGYRRVLALPANELGDVRWSAYARLAELEAQLGNKIETRRNFNAALNSIEENRSQQKDTDHQITFLTALIRFYQEYVELLIQDKQPGQALAVADSSRASVLTQGLASGRQYPRFLDGINGAARESNSVFLFYWLAPQKSYVWAVTPAGEWLKELPRTKAEIEREVRQYSESIQTDTEDTLEARNPLGLDLYQTLIGPVAPLLSKAVRVVVVPDGALHGLNFETLLAGDHYWLQDVNLTVAPSLRILLESRRRGTPSGRVLIIGDGDYSDGQFPPLPESKKEVAEVMSLFPKDSLPLTEAKAVPAAYKDAHPELFSLIHFSAHVEANEKSPLDSAIILSPDKDGNRKLYARDVMNSDLKNADLVTVSGCRSVGNKVLSGEGLVGFAWAAFQAGARNAVTSLWEVDSRSTTQFMGNFYSEVKKGKPYAAALHVSKLAMLSGNQFRKPYYWAPFQLYSRNVGEQ